MWHQREVVAVQDQLTRGPCLLPMVDRQAQSQLDVGRAVAAGFVEHLGHQTAQAWCLHQTQGLIQWPACVAAHLDHRVGEVWDGGFQATPGERRSAGQTGFGALDVQAVTLNEQVASQLGEGGPLRERRRCAGARPCARRVGIGHPVELRRDLKLPLMRLDKGELVQVAPHLQLHVVGTALLERITQVVPRGFRQCGGQIASNLSCLQSLDGGLQIQRSGCLSGRGAGPG